jgi:hypothetical protein
MVVSFTQNFNVIIPRSSNRSLKRVQTVYPNVKNHKVTMMGMIEPILNNHKVNMKLVSEERKTK